MSQYRRVEGLVGSVIDERWAQIVFYIDCMSLAFVYISVMHLVSNRERQFYEDFEQHSLVRKLLFSKA